LCFQAFAHVARRAHPGLTSTQGRARACRRHSTVHEDTVKVARISTTFRQSSFTVVCDTRVSVRRASSTADGAHAGSASMPNA
jgi:hypothetical protein